MKIYKVWRHVLDVHKKAALVWIRLDLSMEQAEFPTHCSHYCFGNHYI